MELALGTHPGPSEQASSAPGPKTAPTPPKVWAPALSVVVLTWNEERNVGTCLASLAAQTVTDFEVIVVDAASTDRTVDEIRRFSNFPVPLRLEVTDARLPIGPARNVGVQLAKGQAVAFLSADAEAEPEWVARVLDNLSNADLVFGRQVHAPTVRTVAGHVRALRYHFPDGPTNDPARYASHVSAAVRRSVLTTFPFGTTPSASAVDDILLARRAANAGYRLAYDPQMVVRHHDVESWRAELRKNYREGLGLGEYAAELGFQAQPLLWGLLLLVGLVFLVVSPGWITFAALLLILWLPALRRLWRRRSAMKAQELLLGTVSSPPYDLAFLFAYLRGLIFPKDETTTRRLRKKVES